MSAPRPAIGDEASPHTPASHNGGGRSCWAGYAGPCALLLSGVALACGSSQADSTLEVTNGSAGAGGAAPGQIRAIWTYRSIAVDVDATLTTETLGAAECWTSGTLRVNKATAATDRYSLEPTSCSQVRLTAGGDIILHDSPSGHDWTTEQLQVDTGREMLQLGPWTSAGVRPATYRVTLAAPECGSDCQCPYLRRQSETEDLVLELGQFCD